MKRALASPGTSPDKVRAYKHVLALLIALRAPTTYLQRERDDLNEKVNEYARLLAKDRVIDAELAAALQTTPLEFLSHAPVAPPLPFARKKAPNAIRTTLLHWLDVPSFYELDRLHLEADGTIDVALQNEIERLFDKLADKDFVRANDLTGERLLRNADPSQVVYSLMLFERTPQGNLLRVNADNLERPFDINGGTKLDLGSTAKLRTLAHYLEIVALLHHELQPLDAAALTARARDKRTDPLTAWAADTLAKQPDVGLDAFLQAALERKYSATPYETFFTGGGMHVFANFDKSDNARKLTVRNALRSSTNLVFVRLMRDLVRYHRARLEYDADALLKDPRHPDRQRMVQEIADDETRQVLLRTHRRYSGSTPDAAIASWLGSRAKSPRHLAILFFAWRLGDTPAELGQLAGIALGEGQARRSAQAHRELRESAPDAARLRIPARPPSARGVGDGRDHPRAGRHLGCHVRAQRRGALHRLAVAGPAAARAAPRISACASASSATPSSA